MITNGNQLAIVTFGKSNSALTVYYRTVDKDNAELHARTNTDVVNLGLGVYGIDLETIVFPETFKGVIHWDNDETQLVASEEMNIGVDPAATYSGDGS